MEILLLTTVIVFFLINIPIAIALGLASLTFLVIATDIPLTLIPQRMFTGIDSFVLLAVPLFILAGELMGKGGISRRLINFAQSLVGWMTGGLSMVTIVTSMFFAGISGSAVADCAAVGSVMIPEQVRKGYAKDYSAALSACSGTIGTMIPPSVPMIFAGILSGTSISALFAGGIIPGILMGFSLMIVAYVICRRRGYAPGSKVSPKEVFKTFLDAGLSLLLPIVILGGIIFGIVTPTEAGAIAVIYSLILSMVVYRDIKISMLPKILIDVAVLTGVVLFILGTANIFGWLLARYQVPQMIAELFLNISGSALTFMIAINILFLIIGTFMETAAALIIFIPVLMPVVNLLGIDPVYFGVVAVVNLSIGMATPPLGVNIFVACSIARLSISQVAKALIPFLLAMIFVLGVITYFPDLILAVPKSLNLM